MPNDKLKQIVNLIKSAEGVSIGALVDRMNLVIKDNNLTREALNDVITAFKQLRDIAVENGVFDRTIAKIEESITNGDDIVSKSVDSKLSASEKKIVSKINDTVDELRQELSAIIPEQFDPTYIEESIKDIEVSLTDTFDKKFDKKIEDAIKNIKFPEVKDYSQDIVDLRNTVALVGTKNYTPAGIEIFHNGRNYGRIPSINFKNGNIEVSASRVDVDLGSGTSSSGGTWGTITGTLSDQTDLQTALNGKVDENAAITGATKTKITYDAKGLVTGGDDATTADIADSSNKRYVTDAQLAVIGNTSGTNTGDQDLSGYALKSGALTQFVGNNNWKVFYSDGSGDIQELSLGADGTFLKSNGASSAPSFAVPAGTGDVTKVGTPVNNQIGVWTGDGTIEGDVDLTWDTATNTLGVGLVGLDARVQVHAVKSDASDGLLIEASDGTDVGLFGTANTANVTWYGSHNFSAETQDTIAAFTGAGKTLGSLALATYPSLTELSYVKGVTSAIQTQINGKQASDATLTALAGLTIAADSLTIGTGADAFSQTTFAANTFPAKASTGSLVAKTITDFGLSLVDDADASAARTTLGLGTAAVVATDLSDLNEATIEAAIDTLTNLTSIQGRTVTLADAGANAFFGWDDTAGAYENLSQAEARTILGLGTAAYVATDLSDLNEATIESAIDTLANLTSIQGRTITLSDAGFDVLAGWDDSAGAYKNFLLADITAEASPASGDYFLMYGAEGDLRKVNFDDMPSGGGVSFGSDNQIPFTNSGGTDFDYSANFTFDGTNKLRVGTLQAIYIPDQTSFTNTMIVGNSGGSLSHSSGIQGGYNFVAGVGAAPSLSTGYINTVIGSRAGNGLSTGTQNTFVGESAGYYSNGDNNTALGSDAFRGGVGNTADFNTAIGVGTLYLASGGYNTALGYAAGNHNTTGTENQYDGFNSGFYNETGSQNTIIGVNAAFGTSGNSFSKNSVFGYSALYAVTTGSNNIAIGYQAGNNITSGANNIIIGYDIDAPSATGSNQLSIGNLIFGDGTATGTTVSTGNIGLGVASSISAKLHVVKTTEQLRLGYDTSNYLSTTINSTGSVTFDLTGTSPEFTFSDPVNVPDEAYGAGWNGNTEVPTKNAVYDKIETLLPLAGGTMTGNITLGENTSIALDPAGSADGKYSGVTVTGTAGYTQAFGDVVYLDPTDSRWEACDANAASGADGDCRGIVGMVVSAGTDGNACTILLQGIIRADANFPTMTVNAPMYISETAGDITGTKPTTTDAVVRVVGFALTADEIYFNPSPNYATAV